MTLSEKVAALEAERDALKQYENERLKSMMSAADRERDAAIARAEAAEESARERVASAENEREKSWAAMHKIAGDWEDRALKAERKWQNEIDSHAHYVERAMDAERKLAERNLALQKRVEVLEKYTTAESVNRLILDLEKETQLNTHLKAENSALRDGDGFKVENETLRTERNHLQKRVEELTASRNALQGIFDAALDTERRAHAETKAKLDRNWPLLQCEQIDGVAISGKVEDVDKFLASVKRKPGVNERIGRVLDEHGARLSGIQSNPLFQANCAIEAGK